MGGRPTGFDISFLLSTDNKVSTGAEVKGMSDALIDLVAVAYNAPIELGRFLSSVVEEVDVPFTLTVIDNNSPDTKVQEILSNYDGKFVMNSNYVRHRFYLNPHNDGYAKAINWGIKQGSAPFVAALNCDVQFLPKTMSKIIAAFRRPDYERVAIIGPKTYDEIGQITHAGITSDGVRDTHRYWMQRNYPGLAEDELDVPTVSGATYFMRRGVWEELTHCPEYRDVAPEAEGAFLPTKHFYEETWCSYHARSHGYRVRYQGDIEMIHSWHRSSPIGSITLNDAEGYFRQACRAHDIELTF